MKKILALLLALALMLSVLAACGDSSTTGSAQEPAAEQSAETAASAESAAPAESAEEKTITYGTSFSHLYMYTSGAGESDNYCRRLVYDQLFYIDDDTGVMTSDILSSWEWVDDVTLKLVLKDGVMFSDGTQMMGSDILFSLQNYVNNQHSEMEFYERIDFDKSYVDEDGLTTYVIYKEVYGCALNNLDAPILSEAFCAEHPDGDDAWWYSPVGSGPYSVGEVTIGSSVEYIKRDDYWNTEKTFDPDRIYVRYYTDTTAMYSDYVNGVIDVMMDISSEQVDILNQTENTQVVLQSANDVTLLCFNEATIPDYIREAIAYGVDWDAVSATAYGNLCTTATSHFATTFDCYSDHAGTYTYDPDHAKEILADNNYDGTLEINYVCMVDSSDQKLGEAIQFYLSELGITFNVDAMGFSSMLPALINGEGDCGLQTTINNGNPTKEVNTAISTLGEGGFKIMCISDPDFNELLNAGLGTPIPEERAEVYKEVDQWLYDHYQALPICERTEGYAYNTEKISSISLSCMKRCGIFNVELY